MKISILVALLSLPAAFARADEPDDETSDWTVPAPPPPGPTLPGPSTPEGGFSHPDRVRFEEQLRAHVIDQLCRQARLDYDYKADIHGFGGPSMGLSRYLATDLGERFALVDEERLRVGLSKGISREIGGAGPMAGFSVSAVIDGRSMVIRRLASKQSCSEIGRILNLRDIKTVLPVNGGRIAAMETGELWRIPLTLSISNGVGLSDVLGDGAAASISFGYSKSGSASMTLYRLSEEKLRFRFRIDYVTTRSAGISVTHMMGAPDFLQGWHGLLLSFVDKELAKQLAKISSFQLGLSEARSDGRRMILEYTVDPRDPEQADAVAEALKGDFRRLLRAARRVATEHITTKDAALAYDELRGISSGHLGEPSYAAVDAYKYQTRNFMVGLPVLFWTNVSSLFGNSNVTRETGELGEFRFHPADRSPAREYFNVPFMGPVVKDNDQRHVEVVTYAPHGEAQGEPIMVYIRNKGTLRVPASVVGENIGELNSILGLAGARRGGDGSRLKIPSSVIPPPTPVAYPDSGGGYQGPTEVSDRSGTASLTLVFNQKAVRESVAAASGEVLKAFASSLGMDYRPMMEWLAANGRIENGKLAYDAGAAKEAFPGEEDPRYLAQLSAKAAGLVADLAAVRDAADNDQRARKLALAVAGRGDSGLSYEDVLKVLIQFVDPMDLTGDFSASVKCSTKGCKDINAHFVLKKNRLEVLLLKEAGEAKSRFAEPSILYD